MSSGHGEMRLATSPIHIVLIPRNQSRSDAPDLALLLSGAWQDLRAPGLPGCPLLCECCGINHQGPVTASISHTAALPSEL